MNLPIKAKDIGNLTREYEYADGSKEYWIGGSKSWRNNNPGNLRDANIPWQGLIGSDSEEFCIFNSYEKGKRAVRIDLTTKGKRGLTLSQAIYEYAPPKDGNNTEAYIEHIVQRTRIHRDTALITVTDRIPEIVEVIEKHEQYREGEVKKSVEEKPKAKVLKKEGQYIWRTSGDKKVRTEHAMREGKVFHWENPPAGGHPGEAHGCRCTAEPVSTTTPKHENNKLSLEEIFGQEVA